MQISHYKIVKSNSIVKLFLTTLVIIIMLSCAKHKDLETYQIIKGDTIMNNLKEYKIKINIGDKYLIATLIDNATTRNFLAMLPLTLKLEDYANTEKISYLNPKLSTEGAPKGCDPEIGDITYYAPWGNLAIFYKEFGFANGLIKLGKIEGDISLLNSKDELTAILEEVK